MTDKLKPMDIYADYRTPFEVAAYCRGHKLTVTSSNLTKALKAETEAENNLKLAERVFDEARTARMEAVEAVQSRMKVDPHV